ncbi:MAG: HAD-IA family hydrolase [Candidatus Sumerlaeia bacterium]|nr:HAD-IA family hydrolase [Candidatus Sumerlaeia bacterium]
MDFSQFDWIFFDLDGTLWDHDTAAREAVRATASAFGLPPDETIAHFHAVNAAIWREISARNFDFDALRRERWSRILAAMDQRDRLEDLEKISDFHITRYLGTPRPLEGIDRVIPRLAQHARLAIATNGFHVSQDPKVAHLGELADYFEFVFCPDDCGALKSDPAFYEALAARAGNPAPQRMLMVGDSLKEDIENPLTLGWQVLWLSGEGKVPPSTTTHPSITSLSLVQV